MSAWLRARYRAFQGSYDPDEAHAASSPLAALVPAVVLIGTILVIGYVPSLAKGAQLRDPPIAIALVLLALTTTFISWKHGCRGPIGTLATLFDNMWWYFGIVYLAVNTATGYAIGFSIAYALAVSLLTTRVYGLSLLFGIVLALPVVVLVPWFRPPSTIALMLLVALSLSLMLAQMTRRRHELMRRHRTLERALNVADEVADESMQAALATMLLGLGHFLHELRNHQTSISANLCYLESAADLSGEARDAVLDIIEAQAAQQRLLARTLEELQQRATPEIVPFSLSTVVGQLVDELGVDSNLVVSGGEVRYQLVGNPDHLKLVLHNLVRNAAQAGAKVVQLDVNVQPNGDTVTLVVHDDGPGVSPSQRANLFQPFLSSTRSQGTGLGLYLCRRYVGLLGGSVVVGDGPLGGAAFTIQLPGKSTYRDSVLRELAKASRNQRSETRRRSG